MSFKCKICGAQIQHEYFWVEKTFKQVIAKLREHLIQEHSDGQETDDGVLGHFDEKLDDMITTGGEKE